MVMALILMCILCQFSQENRFAKCDICVALKMEQKSCLDKEKQAELKQKHQEHLERVE